MRDARPIGVFDSGIGGLTVVRELVQELPNERIVYFGDTARCPYGNRAPNEVMQFSEQILDFLYEQDVKLLVIACNTATAVAMRTLRSRYPVPVIGVIEPGARAAARVSKNHVIGVIGTSVTVQSGAYEQAVVDLCRDAEVHSLACPTFVPWVERGIWNGPEVEQDVHIALHPLRSFEIDTLVLGCTHYPLLQAPIQKAIGASVRLISSAQETAFEIRNILFGRRELNDGPLVSRHQFYASGDTDEMRHAVKDWVGIQDDKVDLKKETLERYTSSIFR